MAGKLKISAGNQWTGPTRGHTILTAGILVMITSVAMIGQFEWAREKLPTWGLVGQILFVASIEGAGIFVCYFAHLADMNNDSSFRLKIAAMFFGVVAASLNWSHWTHGNFTHPTAIAVATAVFSLSSPLLWMSYSKRQARNRLFSLGLIEPHGLRLGANRIFWHPVNSMRLMSHAAWTGETKPAEAIQAYDVRMTERKNMVELNRELDRNANRAIEKGETS